MRCLRRDYRVIVERPDGSRVLDRCRALTCPSCIHIEIYRVARAIALARPNRRFLLTLVGDSWQTIRRRVNRIREYLADEGVCFEWAWHVEWNPGGTGHHVHAWVRSAVPVSERLLRAAARRAGIGMAWVSPVPWPMGFNAGLLEGVARSAYGMKLAHEGDPWSESLSVVQERFLDINGGRLVHASRNFWVDADGTPVPQRTAQQIASRLPLAVRM